jgi:hypothetical protein
MRRYEIPPNAVYSGQGVPEHLVGVPVHQSSEQRLTRAEGLLKNAGRMDEDKLAQVLRDHGANHTPSNLTICQHGPLVSSTRSMICYPQRQSIKLLYGKPCQNEYAPFNLS